MTMQLFFAQGLAETLMRPWHQCLRKLSSEAKKQNRSERRSKMQIRCECHTTHREERVILVDDIYTTGTTARQSYEALGRPRDFEVWVLAYRHLRSNAGAPRL